MPLATVEQRRDVPDAVAELDRLIENEGRRYVAALAVLGPPDIVGEHSEQEIADAKSERYLAGMAIAQLKEHRDELSNERRSSASATVAHRHVPVARARTVARPRERRARRGSARSSSSSDDSASGESEPPGLARRRRAGLAARSTVARTA
jgi:hypothetical protein